MSREHEVERRTCVYQIISPVCVTIAGYSFSTSRLWTLTLKYKQKDKVERCLVAVNTLHHMTALYDAFSTYWPFKT